MKSVNHKLSRQIVNHAHTHGVSILRLEKLAGIRAHTTRQSGGGKAKSKQQAKSRKNNRMMATWSFSQLATFVTYKAARLGIEVEEVDPAYTSQECPACRARNKASDRRYTCSACGWRGHRDAVGAISISRRTSAHGHSVRAVGA
jgi:putative transposase